MSSDSSACAVYQIFGSELSPFSVKIRSYFRFKGIDHTWIQRDAENMSEFQKYAKLPILPLVVTPEGEGLQDSTPIMDAIEAGSPPPSIHPTDSVTRFLSILLEEFGDEWANKWMFHLRWARSEDQLSAGGRIAVSMAPRGNEEARLAVREKIIERMTGRVHFVGSNEVTAPQIESSFLSAIALLNKHLASRPYLFGSRPSYADFGLWGQIYNVWTDPTGAAWIEANGPNVLTWIQRMLYPTILGEFEPWESLEETLLPFLTEQVGALFCPWTMANAGALAAGEEEFSVELSGQTFTQQPQKYHAKSLKVLRARYEKDRSVALDRVLDQAGCLLAIQN